MGTILNRHSCRTWPQIPLSLKYPKEKVNPKVLKSQGLTTTNITQVISALLLLSQKSRPDFPFHFGCFWSFSLMELREKSSSHHVASAVQRTPGVNSCRPRGPSAVLSPASPNSDTVMTVNFARLALIQRLQNTYTHKHTGGSVNWLAVF